MRSSALLVTTLLVLLAGTGSIRAEDVVIRRGGLARLSGKIVGFDDDGVTLRSPTGATYVVTWDRVRDVQSERAELGLADRLAKAERLWRARTRVERGDLALAEPLYAQLFNDSRGRTNAMARLVAEDLARCRIARGAQADAVIPVLELLRLDRAGIENPRETPLPDVLDASTGLCPHLAPVFFDRDAVVRVERGLASYAADDDDVVAAVAHLYRQAARRFLGEPPLAPSPALESAGDDPGVRWLRDVLACGRDEDAPRDAACRRVLDDVDTRAAWQQAWARYAVGGALLRSEDRVVRERGVVHLVHVPARFAEITPFLAGMALERAAAARQRAGDEPAAVALRATLIRMFAAHPLSRSPLVHVSQDRSP